MPELRLVAHDHRRASLAPAAPQKSVGAVEYGSTTDALAVHIALETLPGELALRQGADEVADRLLTGTEILADEAALSRRRNEHSIVGDDRVVEIDPDKHSCISYAKLRHPFPHHICRAARIEPLERKARPRGRVANLMRLSFASPLPIRTRQGRRSQSHTDAHWQTGRGPVRDRATEPPAIGCGAVCGCSWSDAAPGWVVP